MRGDIPKSYGLLSAVATGHNRSLDRVLCPPPDVGVAGAKISWILMQSSRGQKSYPVLGGSGSCLGAISAAVSSHTFFPFGGGVPPLIDFFTLCGWSQRGWGGDAMTKDPRFFANRQWGVWISCGGSLCVQRRGTE